MKNKHITGLVAGVLILSMVRFAGATTVTDIQDPADIFMGKDSSYSFAHYLTGFTPGVVGTSGVDEITSAWLDIYTYDDADTKKSGEPALNEIEKYKIWLDSYLMPGVIDVVNNSTIPSIYTYNFEVFTYLQHDGMLNVKISGQVGDFFFAKSELTAIWAEYVAPLPIENNEVNSFDYPIVTGAPIPEPATILLLGIGMAGLAATMWRKAGKS